MMLIVAKRILFVVAVFDLWQGLGSGCQARYKSPRPLTYIPVL